MTGERDLAVLLSTLVITRRDRPVTVTTTSEEVALGDGVLALIAESEGTTVVATVDTAREHGWPVEFVGAWLTIDAHSALDGVGLTAALSEALAAAGVPCNVLAGYYHDHLLVPLDMADDAVATLQRLRAANR